MDINDLEAKVADTNKIKLDKEKVLNLLKTLPDKMRNGSAVEKDALCRILWLNLRLNPDNTISYLWNEPFNSLLKYKSFATGGDKAKGFEPLARVVEWLIANPKPDWSLQLKEAGQLRSYLVTTSIGEGRELDRPKHKGNNSTMDNVGIYTTPRYTAYIYPNNIVITTRLQAFRITYDRYNMGARLDIVKEALVNNQLEDISDIIHISNDKLQVNACNRPLISS